MLHRLRTLLPVTLACSLVALSLSGNAFVLNGSTLGIDQRSLRVFNNFMDASANDNQTPHPDYPGALGAAMAVWKGVAEWGSQPHGSGGGDPTQANIGDGGANFDIWWRGAASSPGGATDNIVSAIPSCAGGVIAIVEQSPGGWRMRLCDNFDWDDGPGVPSAGAIDIQGVLTHEYGVLLGLGHSSASGATMSATIDPVAARSIEADDQAGIQFIYGVKAATKPRIDEVLVSSSAVHLIGENFDATNNTIQFTDGSVAGVPSNGALISVPLSAGFGPGDVSVRVPGATGASISNPMPLDPTVDDCTPTRYCNALPNTTGNTAMIDWSGSTDVAQNNFNLHVTGALPNNFGIFFYGTNQTSANVGAGVLCVTGVFRLFPAVLADGSGAASRALDFSLPPADSGPGEITTGSTFNFQYWYRDPSGGPFGFNLSSALQVGICP